MFDLSKVASVHSVIVGKKDSNITAPANTAAGPHGTIDWLTFDRADGGTGGLTKVYRTFTAGGKPPKTYEGQPAVITVDYAVQYYFYETQ